MPLFFFDVRYGDGDFHEDEEGSSLDGPEQAGHEACLTALLLARDNLRQCTSGGVTVEVRDQQNRVLLKATASLRIEEAS
jgi:hypothetical protein